MVGNFMDEIDCNSFFDQIDDLLDFSAEDIDVCFPKGCSDGVSFSDSFPLISDTPSESLPNSDSVFCGGNNNNNNHNDLSAELSVPYEDIVQLEWLSNFVEDSFTGGDNLTIKKEESAINKEETSNNQFRTSSPVSVLESSSSCSGGEKSASTAPHSPQTTAPGRCGRARSKRPRPATFSPRLPIQLISAPYPIAESTEPFVAAAPKASFDSENFAESRQIIRIPKHVISEHKKKKKMKMSAPLAPMDENQGQQPVRKCMHCEITKTPQWRAGPMGPKTLCNACGVRYKSGRLFPEYRPAASPTFVPSLHSNSHKKVVEMRTKNIERVAAVSQAVKNASEPAMLIPNNNATVEGKD